MTMVDPATLPSTPFNNPSGQQELVEAWRTLIGKARTPIPPKDVLPAVISINMDGGGAVLSAYLGGIVEVTFPCRILGCHIYAGISSASGLTPTAVSATVDLRLAAQGSWAVGSRALYDGTIPTISGAAGANVSVTGWTQNLQPGDLIGWRLASFSGSATWLSVQLPVRRLDVTSIGVVGVEDGSGSDFVDSSGSAFVYRS